MTEERLRRWRLLLGPSAEDVAQLGEDDQRRDGALTGLYGGGGDRGAGLGASSPQLHRWLGDVRKYFPTSVVQVMQRDAVETLGLRQLLLEPELLQSVEPDVHLVSTLLQLSRAQAGIGSGDKPVDLIAVIETVIGDYDRDTGTAGRVLL